MFILQAVLLVVAMEGLKVAIVQTPIYWLDIDANLAQLEEEFYQSIIGKEYDLVVLPEMFNTGFGVAVATHAEFMNGKTHQWLKNMAKCAQSLLIGSIAIRENGVIYNRLLAVFPEGTTLFYDKKHLFSYGSEHTVFSAGAEMLLLNYKGFVIKPLICYDLRFPVWARNSPKTPYDVLIYVANWPQARQYAWEHLLIARAIENQCYVIGCNRIGKDGNDLSYAGGSCVIDYQGTMLAGPVFGKAILEVELEQGPLQLFRATYPFLSDSDSFQLLS